MDISDSVAKKTMQFDPPIKGSDLIAAVKATCEEAAAEQTRGYSQTKFLVDHLYDDGDYYVIGQSSSQPEQNLLVTATKTDVYIRPEESYDSAVVVSHDPGGGMRNMGRVTRDDEINAVKSFAKRLPRHLPAGQQEDAGRSRDPYAPAAGAVRTQPDGAGRAQPDGQASTGSWRKDPPAADARGY